MHYSKVQDSNGVLKRGNTAENAKRVESYDKKNSLPGRFHVQKITK